MDVFFLRNHAELKCLVNGTLCGLTCHICSITLLPPPPFCTLRIIDPLPLIPDLSTELLISFEPIAITNVIQISPIRMKSKIFVWFGERHLPLSFSLWIYRRGKNELLGPSCNHV